MTRLLLSLTALIIVGIAAASVGSALANRPTEAQSDALQIQSKSAEFAGLSTGEIEPDELELVMDGEGLAYGMLAVYPIVSLAASTPNLEFKTLEKAMEDKEFEVREMDGDASSAQVNSLEVINSGSDSIYLLAGDLVKGGKQDRVLAEDVVIPPGGGPIVVDAYCVEQGRWTVHDSATFGKTEGVVGNKIRKVVMEEKNQQKVWDEVAKNNGALGVSTSTGTYNAWDQHQHLASDLELYKEHFLATLGRYPNAVGFVVVSGDQVTGAEFFISAEMFRERRETLLQGYVIDALANGGEIEVSEEEVREKFQEMLSEYRAIPDSEESAKWHYAKMY